MKLRHICASICIGCLVLTTCEINNTASSQEASKQSHDASDRDGAPPIERGDLASATEKKLSEEERIEYKRNLAQDLVHRGMDYFKNNTIENACRSFAEDEQWQADEMYVFVVHDSGVIYAHGKDNDLIWRHIDEARKERTAKSPIDVTSNLVQEMRKAARSDGWLSYEWDFKRKHTYVQEVEKNGRIFFLGTGFYPESHRFMTKELVKEAIAYAKEYGADQIFQRINNPIGAFVQGPIYLWAYDFDGVSYAHGRNIARIGRHHMDWQGAQGRYVIKDIIERLQDAESTWIEYYEKGDIRKRAYVQRFKDSATGKEYFIGGGYYPEVDSQMVRSFTNRAVDHLKTQGPTVAFRDFTSYTGGFRKGPLTVFVYNMDGTIVADGENPEFVGQNMLEMQDPEGRSVAKEILNKARKHGEGRTTLLDKGQYRELYFEYVDIPAGEYVVGSGHWPDSKRTVAESLAKKAAMNLRQKSYEEALRDFTTWSSEYMRGDLFVEVINYEGIIVAYGPRLSYIWSEVDVQTEEGYNVGDVLIETARTGGGWTSYRSQGRRYHMYVTEVDKDVPTQHENQEDRSHKFVVGVFYI